MVFRSLTCRPTKDTEAAFSAFQKTQQIFDTGFGVFFQSEHSRVAGQLARALRPEVSGPLNEDVINAIAQHDAGWDPSDEQQISRIAEATPIPFIRMPPQDTLPCWLRSIQHGRDLGPLAGILISRHCCLLGTGSGKHSAFVQEETQRREEIEAAASFSCEDLDRWTGALGFCDLLSLYLCSGSQTPVSMPLAHPERSEGARTVTLKWAAGQPVLSEPILQPDTVISAAGLLVETGRLQPLRCEWGFA